MFSLNRPFFGAHIARIYLNTIFWRTAKSVINSEKFEGLNFENESPLEYLPGSAELKAVERVLDEIEGTTQEIPMVINGQEFITDNIMHQHVPHRHKKKIATFYQADEKCLFKAVNAAVKAQEEWDNRPLSERIQIWETGAQLIATKYRAELVATAMLGQSKTLLEAETDIRRLIDHIHLNAQFLKQEANFRPITVDPSVAVNHMRLRGLEGFVAAVTPFNNAGKSGNLAFTPALMGNTVIWKPANYGVLSSWKLFQIMQEAGVPKGVIHFVPAYSDTFNKVVTYDQNLAGINFSGSAASLRKIWNKVSKTLNFYKNFPRLVGECGGKNFHFVHESADVDVVIAATIRAAFMNAGQRSSSCSRLYVPESLWESSIRKKLADSTKELIVDDVRNYKTFFSALVSNKRFLRVIDYIENARRSVECKIIVGGFGNNLKGYFVKPTIIIVTNPDDILLQDELFGPILAVYVYKSNELEAIMDSVANTPKYALAGAVFAEDEDFLKVAVQKFKLSTGNFYINEKCTTTEVGQTPFGGSRMSGTNDKSGGPHYILRWTSPQSIRETFAKSTDIYFPYMNIC